MASFWALKWNFWEVWYNLSNVPFLWSQRAPIHPQDSFFSCVIAFYFNSFFFEHTVFWWVGRATLMNMDRIGRGNFDHFFTFPAKKIIKHISRLENAEKTFKIVLSLLQVILINKHVIKRNSHCLYFTALRLLSKSKFLFCNDEV